MQNNTSGAFKDVISLFRMSNGDIPYSHSNTKEQDSLLLEPFTHLLQASGKNIRKKLLHAFNLWMNIPDDVIYQIGEIVQMLHNASLLIDDIEDNSVLRRGSPVAHKIYGVASTINSANYVMFIGLERLLALEKNKEEAVKVFSEQMLELHRGQGMEIYWRDNLQCPSEEDYKHMTIRKTGELKRIAWERPKIICYSFYSGSIRKRNFFWSKNSL